MRRAVLTLGTVGLLACANCAAGEDLGFYQQDIGGSAGRSSGRGGSGGTSVGSTVATTGQSTGFGGQTVGGGGSAEVDASTSAGGAAGSSGAGGTGGSGGSGSDAAIDRFIPVTKGFILLYKAVSAGSKADAIESEVTIRNMSTDTVPLADITVQYYLVDEITNGPQVKINYAHLAGSGGSYRDLTGAVTIQAKPLTNPVVGQADKYVELGFSGSAGSTVPGDDVVIEWKYNGANFPMVNQANDYSFDGSKTTPTQWDHITILRGGNVIWGTAP
jgi:hypothetical protein